MGSMMNGSGVMINFPILAAILDYDVIAQNAPRFRMSTLDILIQWTHLYKSRMGDAGAEKIRRGPPQPLY